MLFASFNINERTQDSQNKMTAGITILMVLRSMPFYGDYKWPSLFSFSLKMLCLANTHSPECGQKLPDRCEQTNRAL